MSTPTPNHRILLIDDNRAIHEDFRKIFSIASAEASPADLAEAALFGKELPSNGCRVFDIDSAYQGQEGLAMVKKAQSEGRPYAMAFVDVRMPPGWDGIETIGRIWQVYPDLQVVICTAYSDYSWQQMTAKVGQSDRLLILKKPFDSVEVLQMANALTEKWRLVQAARAEVAGLRSQVSVRAAELEKSQATLEAEVAEHKRSESLRQRIEVQLEAAQKLEAIGQLAAGIAHEINTPTQFIGDNLRFVRDGFRELMDLRPLEQQLLDAARALPGCKGLVEEFEKAYAKADVDYLHEEIPKALDQALEGVQRVSGIVRSMKEFSHPGVAEKQNVDLNHAIESTLTVSRSVWKYVADVSTQFDAFLPTVPVLPGEFNQVILNIIVNAAHAIGDVVGDGGKGKGLIRISTRQDGKWAEIRISDTGTGIPESARAHMFELFFTTKGIGKGTGQGLAIAHTVVVEKHGGAITFETETGKGTTFIIRLPLEAAESKPAEYKAA